jgi:hypothetical protein
MFWQENLKETAHLKDPEIDNRILLNFILRKYDGICGVYSFLFMLKKWQALVSKRNEPSGFHKALGIPSLNAAQWD